MNRVVRGSDGRMWNVRSHFEWSDPLEINEWEHDISGSRASGMGVGAVVLLLYVVFILWTPSGVYLPNWLLLAFLVVVLFFPARWLVNRPWTVIAETPGDQDDAPPERWVGVVRGVVVVRRESARVSRNIELHAEPDMNGPLQPVE